MKGKNGQKSAEERRSRGNLDREKASGFFGDVFEGVESGFSQISELSASERHIIYKARRFNRWWVLKGLPGGGDSYMRRALLRKEFEIMMSLPSEGFCRAFSLEEVPGCGPCIVMEYIEGPTLAEWLASEPPRRDRRRVALELIGLAGRLHDAGIVSRDIKPSNILVSRLSGKPVMIDFDLADADCHAAFKSPGGTEGYISPEQNAGCAPDPRNDLYALATVIESMKPSALWRPALRSCRRSIDRRPRDTRQLAAYIRHAELMPRLGLVLGALALVALSLVLFLPGRPGGGTEPHMTPYAYSRPAVSDSADTALRHRVSVLRDSLSVFSRERDEAMARKREVKGASDKVRSKIDDFFRDRADRFLDTMRLKPGVPPPVFDISAATIYYRSLMDGLSERFSPEELSSMEYELSVYLSNKIDLWTKKYRQKLQDSEQK